MEHPLGGVVGVQDPDGLLFSRFGLERDLLEREAEEAEVLSETSLDMDLLNVFLCSVAVKLAAVESDRFTLLVLFGWPFHFHLET